jgi:branched-chain amino acid transport system ATP-binding protein
MNQTKMLELINVNTFYDTSHVLFDLSLEIREREVVCLLGRNGAGKSTTLLSIMGVKPPRNGRIGFMGQDIAGKRPYVISRMGIGLVPQERRIFGDLTVLENLIIAADRKGTGWKLDDVYDLFPVLKRMERRWGGSLSGGEQQMLAIGRTLMTNPRLLMLDEPGEGLSPIVVEDLSRGLQALKGRGFTILLAEQNVHFASKISERAYVIDKGQVRYDGSMDDLVRDGDLKSKYLAV